uniref:Uncharacterized protein n=1 Tax=Clastoptera arizonana TaxID=38151 RepID=A0A1B6EA70_9HEMI
MILPKKWSSDHYKPVCIHMAGTGDHYYWRRRQVIAKPLLKEGNIGSILLENPFYGKRKPKDQVRSILHNVSDVFVMGGCLILESLALFNWCESQGYGPLGVTGMSMGGHMASLAATSWPKPLVVVPCLSWSTASGVFTEGVISGAINWELLETQFRTDSVYKAEIMNMVNVIEDDAFKAGQEFAKDYPTSMVNMEPQKDNRFVFTPPKEPYKSSIEVNIPESNNKNIATSNIFEDSQNSVYNHSNEKPEESNYDSIKGDKKSDKEFKSNVGGLFKFGFPNLSHLKLTNYDDRNNILNTLKNSGAVTRDTNQRMNWREHEALHFMRGIMDECTHLRNFARPVDTSLVIAVCAKDDGYVPREGVSSLIDIWPGAEVRYVDAGHVSAFLLHQKVFRSAIIDAFERAKLKYSGS